MGVLKTITDEYFGDSIREEDKIPIGDLDVELVSFTDMNGKLHKIGYRIKDGDSNEMAKTLKTLIERAIEFRGPECSLNDIDVSNIKQMCYEDNEDGEYYGVFEKSPFNGDISGWDVSNVEIMYAMFYRAKSFNGDISEWNVSRVKDMFGMFYGVISFNQPLDKWDVSSVENMNSMFNDAESFNQDISGWDVSSVENMNSMFNDAESFNQDISGWDVSNVKHMRDMFGNTPLEKNNKLPQWYLDRQ